MSDTDPKPDKRNASPEREETTSDTFKAFAGLIAIVAIVAIGSAVLALLYGGGRPFLKGFGAFAVGTVAVVIYTMLFFGVYHVTEKRLGEGWALFLSIGGWLTIGPVIYALGTQ